DERLKNIPPQMIETIMNEMLDNVAQVTWDDIVGLALAKATIKETVVFPMLRPDIFQGLRAPAKGEVFGPDVLVGKTLIGKCIASQCKASFFSISSSSLTSKWVCVFDVNPDGEKLVRALFAVARVYQPSVIFVDEIDSLLSKRNDGEHDATRRIKTEFLVQFDGCATDAQDRILMIGDVLFLCTRPQEIDEAVRRRFRKKLYVPLPEAQARTQMIRNRMASLAHSLTDHDLDVIVGKTEGYSGSDMDGLVREASLGPIRAIDDIQNVNVSDIRPVVLDDFMDALTQVRASVSRGDLDMYTAFDREFGSVARPAPPP
ncbi:P-loop containing nucleoside triphosphate hydrolase protein, partial [Powellomyces hirtus]